MQELSAGQVTTMARNEKVIEKLSGQPATCDLKGCLTVAWLNGMLASRLPQEPCVPGRGWARLAGGCFSPALLLSLGQASSCAGLCLPWSEARGECCGPLPRPGLT